MRFKKGVDITYYKERMHSAQEKANLLFKQAKSSDPVKWYATEIYNSNGFDIALVQRLLQHSSAATTQRYIGIEPQRIEQAIQNHAQLL